MSGGGGSGSDSGGGNDMQVSGMEAAVSKEKGISTHAESKTGAESTSGGSGDHRTGPTGPDTSTVGSVENFRVNPNTGTVISGAYSDAEIEKGYTDQGEKLSNVKYYYTPNTEQLLGTVDSLSKLMLEIHPRIVILDGAIGQFREEYLGRGTLSERQNQIARLMTHIKNISFYFRCVVLFTNQVQSDPSVMFGDPVKPIGGNIVAHASTYRVYLKKSGKKRIARMVDSPEHEQKDASYQLTVKGIEDAEKA